MEKYHREQGNNYNVDSDARGRWWVDMLNVAKCNLGKVKIEIGRAHV